MSEPTPNGLPTRLREGINPLDQKEVAEAEAVMDAAAAEIDRLRADFEEYRKVKSGQIDYLRAENEELRSMIAAAPLASDQERQKSD